MKPHLIIERSNERSTVIPIGQTSKLSPKEVLLTYLMTTGLVDMQAQV